MDGTQPRTPPTFVGRLKRVFLGRPFATEEADHQLLPKRLALPLFASDPLSSVAYATEEIMLVLALAGAAAFSAMIPISLAIVLLVVVVVTSYRQTVRAYPQGGGAYLVTRDNLGKYPAMTAASALLIDYVLTVAVSVTAGVAAITSAFPSSIEWKLPMAIGLIVFLALTNLRGVRETGRLFAIPTYLFFVMVIAMLVVGFVRCTTGVCPTAATSTLAIEAEIGGLGLLLVMRAFASGSTALTGIEAIADGVQAFRRPKARNAANTLAIMAAMSITMFIGITALARLFEVRVTEATVDEFGSVLSQIGRTAFGENAAFFVLQAATMGILVLAANTAYQDFPRLSAILAGDRLMPRQMRNRGDRLVFSNGVVILSLMAMGLIVAFDATLSRLIQLYVVGVFVSFTLSQTSMVRRWFRERTRGWKRSAAINAIGATTTGVVLVVVASAKFAKGAWLVVLAIPLLVFVMSRIWRHYDWMAAQLSLFRDRRPAPLRTEALVMVSHVSRGTLAGVEYARMIGADRIQCVHVQEGRRDELWLDWQGPGPDIPLVVIRPRRRGLLRPLRAFINDLRWDRPRTRVVVIIPEMVESRRLWWRLTHLRSVWIRASLLSLRDVVVTNMVFAAHPARSRAEPTPASLRTREVVIPVGGVTQATLDAVSYAQQTHPMAIHAVHATLDDDYAQRSAAEWAQQVEGIELTILPNPFRATTAAILQFVRELRATVGPGVMIDVLIPEFIVPTAVGRLLHNKTALALKNLLRHEPGVVFTSVPWVMRNETEAYSAKEITQ